MFSFRWNVICNAYSAYSKQFVEPVFKKDAQDALYESGEIEKTIHAPVKAALTDATSSVFHDEHVRYAITFITY